MDASNKQFLANQLMVMVVSFGISIAISILVPFPISLVVIIGVFILFNFYMRNRMMRKTGMGPGGTGGIFNSMSSSMAGGVNSTINYYCMSCGTPHKQLACPNCGSRMKKVGF